LIGRVLMLSCLALLGLALTGTAHANGDPPSDLLLVTDVYRPYLPPVRPAVLKALSSTVAQARHRGRPVKVALIASVIDLGNVRAFGRNRAHTHAFSPKNCGCLRRTAPVARKTPWPATRC
jgi:hypothetical protein